MNESPRQMIERDLETRKRRLAEATEVVRRLQAKPRLTHEEELTLRASVSTVTVESATVNALADQLSQMP